MGRKEKGLYGAIREQRRRNDAEAKRKAEQGRNGIERGQHRRRMEEIRATVAAGKLSVTQKSRLIREYPELAGATKAALVAKMLAIIDSALAALKSAGR